MSIKNPDTYTAPESVVILAAALEKKLGRPSYIRQVKNSSRWFISDPMFSFVQHGLRKGATGYRVGLYYLDNEDILAFYLVHSPVMAELFKKNLQLTSFIQVAKKTAFARSRSYLRWSSRSAWRHRNKWAFIEEASVGDFISALRRIDNDHGFVADLFPKIENQKTGGGSAKWAGNDFFFLLADDVSNKSKKHLSSIVELIWPLFLCLYPVSAIEQRASSLARNLVTSKLQKVCEYHKISNRPKEPKVSSLCRGGIEGAHIKPHSLGGTDKLENGLWLCQYHHRETEGCLIGHRNSTTINVRFVQAQAV
ncbi:MAG: HNH endonuclease [Rhodanobacter sp.]|jgi:hypothetical protein|nr:HNH endonuclease [Rhodanobacter sp.]